MLYLHNTHQMRWLCTQTVVRFGCLHTRMRGDLHPNHPSHFPFSSVTNSPVLVLAHTYPVKTLPCYCVAPAVFFIDLAQSWHIGSNVLYFFPPRSWRIGLQGLITLALLLSTTRRKFSEGTSASKIMNLGLCVSLFRTVTNLSFNQPKKSFIHAKFNDLSFPNNFTSWWPCCHLFTCQSWAFLSNVCF